MYDHIADALGREALVRLDDGLVCLRFESMKIISAAAAVRDLLDRGVLRAGDTVVDSSSGIYALALALACHRHDLRCHIVGSTTVDEATLVRLEVLGARVERMSAGTDLALDQARRVVRVREILRDNPGHHWMRQYHDDIHYLGYRAVADRIAAALDPARLRVVGGVGSGASTGGLATHLRRYSPDVRLVGVQPFGSVTFGAGHTRDPEIIIAGIGSSIPFDNVRHTLYDTTHWVGFDAAVAGAVDLLRAHAVFAGLSTGAAYLCARWERRADPDRTTVFIAADTGHRYVDSVFARHADTPPVDAFTPRRVADTEELTAPWCRMDWAGRPDPARASAA